MTLFAVRTRDDLLAVRFACSPLWETQAAVQTLADGRAHSEQAAWHRLVQEATTRLDLTPLLVVLQRKAYVPDFLAPPPRAVWPRLRDQLAEIRATPQAQVARELERCREGMSNDDERRLLDAMLADPRRARDLLADRLHEAWRGLVAPFWVRIRTLLDRDIQQRSQALVRHGFGRVLGELHPRVRWTSGGLSCLDRSGRTVELNGRGLVLMPSAFLSPHVAAIVEEPWLPTIVYPARGIAELWRTPSAPADALERLLGRTRALVLASLDQPLSTTALAELLELSPAGVSRHLIALRDAGLTSRARDGHQVRYSRTELGSELLHGRSR